MLRAILAAAAAAILLLAAGCDTGGPSGEDKLPLAVSRLMQFEGRGTVGRALAEAGDGGFLLLANYAAETSLFMENCAVLKLDAGGGTVWSHKTDPLSFRRGHDLRRTAGGGAIVSGDHHIEEFAPADLFLLELDADGAELWSREYGGELEESGRCCLEVTGGGFLAAGYRSTGGDDFLPWALRAGAAGDSLWQASCDQAPLGAVHSLCLCHDGGFLLGGTRPGAGFLWRLGVDGETLWYREYFGGLGASIEDLVELPGGDFAFTGVLTTGIGSGKLLMGRCSHEGSLRWYQAMGTGFNMDVGTDLSLHPDGGFLVGGATSSYSRGDAAFWLLHFDTDGHLLWDGSYESLSYNWCYAALASAEGDYAATGFCTDSSNANRLWFIRTEPYVSE